jgi:hypothetical protein
MRITISLLTLGLAAAVTPAAANERLYGLTFNNRIVSFMADAPEMILTSRSIMGLPMGESLTGLDVRPATGVLYTVGTSGTLYSLTPGAGGYMAMAQPMLSVMPGGQPYGFDFNPVPDRLRLVNAAGQNLRINTDTGATIADGMISSDTGMPMLVAAAYTNNRPGATTTTLYALDAATDQLLRSTNPNAGTYTGTNLMGMPFGPLGFAFTTDNAVGFDISGRTGTAFANIDSLLWTIDLATGAGTALGIVGAGPLRSIATTGVVPEPGTWALLVAGFGLMGASIRRRRPAIVTA